MPDISIVWDAVNNRGDWQVANGDLATGGDLQSAVLLSLFTDRVLPADLAAPDGSDDRRGWWGDTYEPSPIGSRLWTLFRAKKADAATTLQDAKDYCLEALKWLLEDQVVATIDVTTLWLTDVQLGIQIVITQPNAGISTLSVKTTAAGQFSWAWQGVP